MRTVFDFVKQFTRKKVFDEKDLYLIDEKKVYSVSKQVKEVLEKIPRTPFLAGTPLGKSKGNIFFPTFPLLRIIKRHTSCRVWIDKPTEWLYICGRDIFAKGIIRATGHIERGGIPIILNQFGEVLGFGKITKKLTKISGSEEAVIDNIVDIGDFLRREKRFY